jgi:predicted dehydrogenase
MADRLRCAVIGTGAIGIHHLTSLMSCPRASAVALSESDHQRAKETADRYRIPRVYSDYQELLEQPDIDAVIISTPNHLHARVAVDALNARKHVLLEKPMATNYKDAAKIVDAAKKMRRVAMVGQNFRFKRDTQTAKAMIDRGDLGEVYHARCFWLRRNAIPRIGSWFTQKQFAGGGCTIDIACHMLDSALHLMREFDATTVTAQTYAKFGPRGLGEFDWGRSEVDPKKPFDVEDYSAAFIRLKSGRTVILESSWAAYHAADAREYGIDLMGMEAGLTLFPARVFKNGPNGYETIDISVPKLAYDEDRVHHFVSCVLESKRPMVSLEESLKLQKILDAIYLSAKNGKEVKVA